MDGTDQCASCGTERAAGESGPGTEAIERGAFFLGLFGVFQAARMYATPHPDPWVQVARGVMAAIGVGLLITYHRFDLSRLNEGAQTALKAALGAMVLLSLAVWLR